MSARAYEQKQEHNLGSHMSDAGAFPGDRGARRGCESAMGATVQHLQKELANNVEIQQSVNRAARNYLESSNGLEFVQGQVGLSTVEYLTETDAGKGLVSRAVASATAQYLASDAGQTLLKEKLANATPDYFHSPSGGDQLSSIVKQQLKSDDLLQMIDAAIRNGLTNLRASIEHHQKDVVAEVESLDKLRIASVPKAPLRVLDNFLNTSRLVEVLITQL